MLIRKYSRRRNSQLEHIKDLGSGEKGEKEISIADVPISTAGAEVSAATHDVSTAAATLVYIRRSASKAKDKGKAIMQEPEPPKKLKKNSTINTTNPLVATTDSSASDYDSTDEYSVCSTTLSPLEKLAGAEPVYGPKTIKSILKSNSTFKSEALKGVTPRLRRKRQS
ncbi:hypothetical protein Tco_1284263 [Tanacetum coccineum]